MLGLSESGRQDNNESRQNYTGRPDYEIVLESFEAPSWGDI
jgi:hypothetical protein